MRPHFCSASWTMRRRTIRAARKPSACCRASKQPRNSDRQRVARIASLETRQNCARARHWPCNPRQSIARLAPMLGSKSKVPAVLALVASLLGLLFASNSTLDYAKHLDRRLHDVHCSFIPGAPATSEAEACRVAMYSPYSALFKEHYWGGIPISLFALGAFAFYAAFAVYLLVYGARAPKRALRFFAAVSVVPLLVSLVM